MVIIGIAGAISHGKTTLANAFSKVQPETCQFETYQLVAEVANKLHQATTEAPLNTTIESLNAFISPLPQIINDITHTTCSYDDITISKKDLIGKPILYEKLILHIKRVIKNPGLLEHEISAENKGDYRAILQWLGGYLVLKVDKEIWYRELLRRIETTNCKLAIIGGVRFLSDAALVHQAGGYIIEVERPDYGDIDSMDPTERERRQIKTDCKVINNGSIADLADVAKTLLNDIKNHRLKSNYIAAEKN